MKRTIATACVLAMISGAVWAQQPSPHTPPLQKTHVAKKKKKAARKKKPSPPRAARPRSAVPAQTMPPVPATLMNSAPVKPSVTMEDGMLTIDAPNSTLSDVLGGVHKATGAAIEGAPRASASRCGWAPANPRRSSLPCCAARRMTM